MGTDNCLYALGCADLRLAYWFTKNCCSIIYLPLPPLQVDNCDRLTKPRIARPNLVTDEPVCPDGQLQCGDGECINKGRRLSDSLGSCVI